MVARRWGECCGGAIVREFGMDVYTLLFLKWIINRVLLYSTWNSVQYYMAAWQPYNNSLLYGSLDGRGVWGRMDTCVCMAESLHCPPAIITTLLTVYTQTQNKKLKKIFKKFKSENSHQKIVINVTRALLQSSISLVQSPSHVRLFATPWSAARQASLSIIISVSIIYTNI